MDNADKRVAFRHPVDLRVEIQKNEQKFEGAVINCSLSGIFLRTSQPLAEQDRLQILIHLPDVPDPISIASRVIWTDWAKAGFGVHFIALTEEQSSLLRAFLGETDPKRGIVSF